MLLILFTLIFFFLVVMKSKSQQDLHEIYSEKGRTLYLGDYNSALDKKNLRKLGIKSVLTAASGLRISYIRHLSIIKFTRP